MFAYEARVFKLDPEQFGLRACTVQFFHRQSVAVPIPVVFFFRSKLTFASSSGVKRASAIFFVILPGESPPRLAMFFLLYKTSLQLSWFDDWSTERGICAAFVGPVNSLKAFLVNFLDSSWLRIAWSIRCSGVVIRWVNCSQTSFCNEKWTTGKSMLFPLLEKALKFSFTYTDC